MTTRASLRFMGPKSPSIHSKYQPTTSPIFKSPYGPFPPVPLDLNMHSFCFPPNVALPADYPLFVDARTSRTITLHQFYHRICALSRVLHHSGPNPLGLSKSPLSDKEEGGEILGIFSRNCGEWPMVAHACFRAELVFGGISPGSTPYELWHVCCKMQVTSIVVHESLLPVLEEALRMAPAAGREGDLPFVLDRKKIIVLSEESSLDSVRGYPTLESLVRLGEMIKEKPRELHGGDRLCYLFQSSGTSGLPKAMMISHKNAIHSGMQTLIRAERAAEFLNAPDIHPIILGIVPAYHSYGMIMWTLRINLAPATNIMLPKWDLQFALETIQKYRITHLPLVPPLVRQLAQSPLLQKYDLSSVIACSSGAAYLPPDVSYALGEKLPQKTPIPSGYGLSEAASIASPAIPGMFGLPPAGPSTIGYLLAGVEARVVDPDTLQNVPKGAKGELWVRSHVVTPGYFRDPKATAEIFTEPGWLRTGDLVMRDDEDRLHYLDRLKEMIKVKGLQVAATEVEDTLLAHPERLVTDACVAGVDNGRGDGGLVPRGWVVLSQGARREDQQVVMRKLDEFVKTRLSKHKHLVGGIEVVDSIPRTPSGKMLRREMRDGYHARIKAQGNRPKL